jgi:hypothetical protein
MAAVLQPSSALTDRAEFFLRPLRLLMASKIIFINQKRPADEETTPVTGVVIF